MMFPMNTMVNAGLYHILLLKGLLRYIKITFIGAIKIIIKKEIVAEWFFELKPPSAILILGLGFS